MIPRTYFPMVIGRSYTIRNKFLLLIAFSLTLYSCSNENKRDEIRKEFYPNGKLKYEASFKKGVQHGIFRAYYETGELESESFFENGEPEGEMLYYFKSGKLKGRTLFSNGKLNGTIKGWDSLGTLRVRSYYLDHHKFYSERFNSSGDIEFQEFIPFVESPIDTISEKETWKFSIHKGNLIRGKVNMLIAFKDEKTKRLNDTIAFTELLNEPMEFEITPQKVGENNVYFLFSHDKSDQDSIDIDWAGHKLNFYVLGE